VILKIGRKKKFEIKNKKNILLFDIFSVAEVLNHLNSNQRLLRSHPKSNNNSTTSQTNLPTTTTNLNSQTSSNVFNTAAAAITSRFISDPQGKIKYEKKKEIIFLMKIF
jgi:trehalose-6-phosphate synthase